MKSNQPVNLNLFKFKFPLTAITSIIHRLSGVLLFLLLPVMLCALATSLHSETSFLTITAAIAHSCCYKFVLWVTLAAALYHLVAGVRHLILDLGIGESTSAAKASAIAMLIIFVALAVWAGVWIW